MGSLRVRECDGEQESACEQAGRVLGPYRRSRSRASESVSPRHGVGADSAGKGCATSASDGQDRTGCVSDHSMCERPWNVRGCPVPLTATANPHDNRVGVAATRKPCNDLYRMAEFDVYRFYPLQQLRVGGGFQSSVWFPL